jgi:hypothetical protein
VQQQNTLRTRLASSSGSSKATLNAAAASLVWKNFGANSNDFPAQFDAYRALSNVMHALLGDVSSDCCCCCLFLFVFAFLSFPPIYFAFFAIFLFLFHFG